MKFFVSFIMDNFPILSKEVANEILIIFNEIFNDIKEAEFLSCTDESVLLTCFSWMLRNRHLDAVTVMMMMAIMAFIKTDFEVFIYLYWVKVHLISFLLSVQ